MTPMTRSPRPTASPAPPPKSPRASTSPVGAPRMIPPPAQRAMAERAGARTAEVPAGHAVHVSRPDEAADFIRQAAEH